VQAVITAAIVDRVVREEGFVLSLSKRKTGSSPALLMILVVA